MSARNADTRPAAETDGAEAHGSRLWRWLTSRVRWAPAMFRALRIVAAPLFLSLVAALVFYAPEQMRDVYRAEAEQLVLAFMDREAVSGFGDPDWTGFALMVASVWLMAATLGAAARYAADRLTPLARADEPPAEWMLRLAPVIAYLAPLLGFLAGLYEAFDIGSENASTPMIEALAAMNDQDRLAPLLALQEAAQRLGDDLLRPAAIAVGALAAAHAALLWFWRRAVSRRGGPSANARFWRRLAVSAALIAAVAAMAIWPVTVPEAAGAAPLVAGFFIALAFIGTQLSVWSQRFGAPLIVIALAAAVGFSLADWTDNHRIRRIADAPPIVSVADAPQEADLCAGDAPFASREPGRCRAGDAFRAWLAARADLQEFKDKGRPYPVYVVAAQGGGAYAATHTLQALRRAHASCNRFNQHLFAISGVSGGSVGAAFYGAMAKRYSENARDLPCPEAPLAFAQAADATRLAMSMVSQDFLSPLLGGLLYTDAAQRFIPVPIPEFSRARAQEMAFEQAWIAGHAAEKAANPSAPDPGASPLAEGLLSHWTPDGAAPALIFNATEAGTGRRRVIAPFRFGDEAGDLRFMPLSKTQDVPISAAASVSARFPWASPAGWFLEPDEKSPGALRKVRLVDGGYFENSGVATALALIEDIEAAAAAARAEDPELPEIAVSLIVLTTASFPERGFYGLGEMMEPLRALLNGRQARTPIEIARAVRLLDGPLLAEGRGVAPRLRRVPVSDLATRLPLGWRLSAATRLQIALQSGDPTRCVPDAARFERTEPPALSADCVLRLIHHELRGDDVEEVFRSLRAGR